MVLLSLVKGFRSTKKRTLGTRGTDQIFNSRRYVHQEVKFTNSEVFSYQNEFFFLSSEGEPFTQEEMDEMLSAAVDPDKNVILYRDFVSMMTFDDTR